MIFVAILIGLPSGFFAMRAATAQPSATETSLEMFSTYCLPMIEGITPQPDSRMLEIASPYEGRTWAEPIYKLLLVVDTDRCSVSDIRWPYTVAARTEFQDSVATIIATQLPMLAPKQTEAMEAWDYFAAWTSTETDGRSDSRWGVTLTRWRDEGEDTETRLTLSLPVH